MKRFITGHRFWLAGLTAVLVVVGMHVAVGNVMAVGSIAYEKIKVFSDVYNMIKQNYVEEVDQEKLLYGAVQGMLKTLDPHSSFLTPENYREMKVDTRGEFGGLGIEISRGDGAVKVVAPIEGTPAFEAGMKSGDLIVRIDNEETQDMDLMEAVRRMRGKPGTNITLTVMRKDEPKPLTFTLTRAVIKVRSVKWRIEDGKIGYVRITQFNEQSFPLLKEAVEELEKQSGGYLNGLVLDLRNDPGGLLDQAVQVADAFLEDGSIVFTKGRIPGKDMSFDAQPGDLLETAPIVVLINEGSASASEIVAGALQDHKRAVIMGTHSFGKGSVQTIFPLMDGSGLRLTTAQYFTPNGRSIQAKGIVPDIVVEDRVIGNARATQPHRTEADLKGHLEGAGDPANNKEKAKEKEKRSPAPEVTPPPAKPEGGEGSEVDQEKERANYDRITGRSKDDYQLQRALDLLRGYQVFNRRNGKPFPGSTKEEP
ncbi:MAG: S41 family peptidase [Magnetococcales bacterium]|nr:S41 family peptidase [Magnetococcales bacterium]